MFNIAQLNAGILFANITFLRDELQVLFRENLMDCNLQEVVPMRLLFQALKIERSILMLIISIVSIKQSLTSTSMLREQKML